VCAVYSTHDEQLEDKLESDSAQKGELAKIMSSDCAKSEMQSDE
jgi:hypothetical protein